MHRDMWIMPRLTESERAMLRSQSDPGAGLCLSANASSCEALRIASHLFQALLLRRLRPSPPPPHPQSNHLLLWPSNRPFWRPSCSVWCAFRFPPRWFVPVWMILVVTLVVFRGKKGGRESPATRRGKPGTTTRKNQRTTTRGQQPEFYNVGFVVLELTFFSSRTIFASVPSGGEEEPKRTFFLSQESNFKA